MKRIVRSASIALGLIVKGYFAVAETPSQTRLVTIKFAPSLIDQFESEDFLSVVRVLEKEGCSVLLDPTGWPGVFFVSANGEKAVSVFSYSDVRNQTGFACSLAQNP